MVKRTGRRLQRAALLGVSLAALATAARAGAAAEAASPSAETAVGEVVVTAEKRETTVQKAALAITALSADTLTKANITRLQDLNGHVPGLTVASSGPFNQVLAIRGVGFETPDNASSEPGVSFHVDGVYIANANAIAAQFLDTERVEVLRGPQGTVFGQSSTGGAINLISYKPVIGAFDGHIDASYGTYNLVKTDGAVNIPLTDQFAARLSFETDRHDGFARELYVPGNPGYQLDDENNFAGKAAVLWQPTNTFSVLLSAQEFHAQHHGPAMKSIYDPDPDPRQISQDLPNTYYLDVFLATGEVKWELPFATLKSTTGYQRSDNVDDVDNDRLAYEIHHYYDDAYWYNPSHTFTQEVNLTSNKPGPVDWLVGGFYLHETATLRFYEFEGTDADPTITFPTSQANLPYNYNYSVFTNFTRESYAAYGQTTVHIMPWLRVTGGLRYSQERLYSVTNTDFLLYSPLTYLVTGSHELTGKVEVDGDLTHANMLYASWSRGFKPGGVNLNNTPILAPQIFKPETVSAFEVGSKNRFFDNRLTLNLAGFYYDYKEFQYEEEDPLPYQGGVSNIPDAHIYGFEGEGSFAITSALRLNASLTRLEGTFTDSYVALDPSLAAAARAAGAALGYGPYSSYTIASVLAAAQNTKGNPVPKIPDWQGSVNLEHRLALPTGVLSSRLELVYRGSYVYRIFDTAALDNVPSYETVNLNVEYKPNNSHFKYSITATNLFNSNGIESRYSNPFGSFTTDQQYIPPLQVFGTVRYEF